MLLLFFSSRDSDRNIYWLKDLASNEIIDDRLALSVHLRTQGVPTPFVTACRKLGPSNLINELEKPKD